MKRPILIVAGIIVAAGVGFLIYAFGPVFTSVKVEEAMPLSSSPTKNTPSFPVVGTTGHPAEGVVRVVDTPEGAVIRFENFKTINGPDLFVYLAKDLEAKEFVDLGRAKGTEGNINYSVPPGVSLEDYRYVMTWCKRFGVLFNYAEIN